MPVSSMSITIIHAGLVFTVNSASRDPLYGVPSCSSTAGSSAWAVGYLMEVADCFVQNRGEGGLFCTICWRVLFRFAKQLSSLG